MNGMYLTLLQSDLTLLQYPTGQQLTAGVPPGKAEYPLAQVTPCPPTPTPSASGLAPPSLAAWKIALSHEI